MKVWRIYRPQSTGLNGKTLIYPCLTFGEVDSLSRFKCVTVS